MTRNKEEAKGRSLMYGEPMTMCSLALPISIVDQLRKVAKENRTSLAVEMREGIFGYLRYLHYKNTKK